MKIHVTVAVAITLFLSCAVCFAEPATQPTTEPTTVPATAPTTEPTTAPIPAPTTQPLISVVPGDGLLLNFKDTSLDVVLSELSDAAGFIVVKPGKLEGRATLLSKQPISPAETVTLLNSVLQKNGYVAVQMGRILKIVPRDKAKKASIPVFTGTDPELIPATDDVITQVMPIRFGDAVQLKQDLAAVIGPDAEISSNASSNALILTDTAANIRRIAQIINSLDQRMAVSAEVRVFPLKYASAASAAKLINDLLKDQDLSAAQEQSQNPFVRMFSRGGPGGDGRGGQSGGSAPKKGKVNAASDDRTNTVVVSGPPEQLVLVEKILKDLDSNPAEQQSVFIYNLKNGQAIKLQDVINALFNETGMPTRSSSGGMNNQSAFGSGGLGSNNAFGSRGGMGSSSSFGSGGSFGSNGLGSSMTSQNGRYQNQRSGYGGSSNLSSGSLRTASDLAGQVTVVANEDTNSLLVSTNPKNYERVKQVLDDLDRPVPQVLIKVLIAEVTHGDNHDLGAEFSFFNLRAGGLGSKGGTGFGVASGITQGPAGFSYQMLEDNASVAIRALETNTKTDVLSRPYVLASDNQLATIMVGQEVPFVTRTQTTDTGQTINTIQYQDVGIILYVTPHINPDGLVILDVAPQISAFSARTVPIQPGVNAPVFDSRSAQSRVAIRDGQTIVFGGLMEDRLIDHVDKVPILGDIPGLGLLFQSKHTEKTKTELLIFLTPHIATSPETLKRISTEEEKGLKLIPKAIDNKAFKEQIKGMRRGSTQPADEK